MKKLLLLFLVLAAITACAPKHSAAPDEQEIEITYRGIPIGKDVSEVNFDSLLDGRIVVENIELLSHINKVNFDEKEIVAQFIDSIVVNENVIFRGFVSVYAYNNKISDIVFNTKQTASYSDLVRFYESKYGKSKETGLLPFRDDYFDSRGNEWHFKNATIIFYNFVYHKGKSQEYIDMSMLSNSNRTEIIYRDNKVHQEVLDLLNARRQHEEDSIQHIKDSLRTAYKSIRATQDI